MPPPPMATAASLLPSAEEAMDFHSKLVAVVKTQLTPKLVEVYMPLPHPAANLPPSAEEAIQTQSTLVIKLQ